MYTYIGLTVLQNILGVNGLKNVVSHRIAALCGISGKEIIASCYKILVRLILRVAVFGGVFFVCLISIVICFKLCCKSKRTGVVMAPQPQPIYSKFMLSTIM